MDWFSKPVIFLSYFKSFINSIFWHIFCLSSAFYWIFYFRLCGRFGFCLISASVCSAGIRGGRDKGKAHTLLRPVFNFQIFNPSSVPSIVPGISVLGLQCRPGLVGAEIPPPPLTPARGWASCALQDQTSIPFPASTDMDQSLDRGAVPVCFLRVPKNLKKKKNPCCHFSELSKERSSACFINESFFFAA